MRGAKTLAIIWSITIRCLADATTGFTEFASLWQLSKLNSSRNMQLPAIEESLPYWLADHLCNWVRRLQAWTTIWLSLNRLSILSTVKVICSPTMDLLSQSRIGMHNWSILVPRTIECRWWLRECANYQSAIQATPKSMFMTTSPLYFYHPTQPIQVLKATSTRKLE